MPLGAQEQKTPTSAAEHLTRGERHTLNLFPVMGDPFTAQVVEVRSLSRAERVGFGRKLKLYYVSASGPQTTYSVYCVNAAPDVGKTYTAEIDYVDGSLSWLHLWPEERKNLHLPASLSTHGMAYKVLIFRDIASSSKSDLACDVKGETARLP
jgi:hypothetical protein